MNEEEILQRLDYLTGIAEHTGRPKNKDDKVGGVGSDHNLTNISEIDICNDAVHKVRFIKIFYSGSKKMFRTNLDEDEISEWRDFIDSWWDYIISKPKPKFKMIEKNDSVDTGKSESVDKCKSCEHDLKDGKCHNDECEEEDWE